jgi:hypothetical protein
MSIIKESDGEEGHDQSFIHSKKKERLNSESA